MINSTVLTLPDQSICLICNTRPKWGTDDLCDACAWRLLGTGAQGNPPMIELVGRPNDRHRSGFEPSTEFDASPGQENAIRHLEDALS